MYETLRHGVLRWWSQLVMRHVRWTLIFCTASAALALLVTVVGVRLGSWRFGPLAFQSDRNALIEEGLDWNQWFLDWQDHFPGVYDLMVVVDADPNQEGLTPQKLVEARRLVDELSRELLANEHVVYRVARFDAGQILQARMLLQSPSLGGLIARFSEQFRAAPRQKVNTEHIVAWMNQLANLLDLIGERLAVSDKRAKSFASLVSEGRSDEDQIYLTSDNDRLFFIRVTPYRDPDALNALADSIQAIRQIIEELSEQYPALEVGLTGLEVIETDETAVAIRDTTVASLMAFGFITALLVLAFHSWRTPLLVAISLLFGIAWSFGFLTIVVGHLQVISVVFTVILLGLGIAYGIHLASRFELIRHQYPDNLDGLQMAMRDTFQTMGPGVVTGAVTTAAAFSTTLFTDFKGVAEMGLIASVGILLCLLAMFSVFPVLLRLKRAKHRHVVPMQDRLVHFFEDRWIMPFVHWPRLTLLVAALVTGVSVLAITQMRFDYNLMKLQPRNIDSVTWQQRVAQNSERSVWFAVSVCNDLEEARRRAREFRRSEDHESARDSYVSTTIGGVAMLFAQDDAADGPTTVGAVDLGTQLSTMQWAMQLATRAAIPQNVKPSLDRLDQAIRRAVAVLTKLDSEQRQRKLDRLEQEYRQWRGQRIREVLYTSQLMKPFREVGERGRVILEVYPKLPDDPRSPVDGPLHPDFLPEFYRQLSSVDAKVTGPIVQIYQSGKLIKDSYLWVGVVALLVVFLLVLLDFRRFDDAVLALIPVGVGFAVTFGVMWLLGMSINPANIIVLPLMFGIGVDSGVHILHRYRQDPITRPLGLSHGTGKGITVSSLTTVIGFGCMMLAKHRGIASLGFVLALGILMTMLACWTVMPAWLELRENAKRKKASRMV